MFKRLRNKIRSFFYVDDTVHDSKYYTGYQPKPTNNKPIPEPSHTGTCVSNPNMVHITIDIRR